ncbi:septum site-determining protein MinC [Synechococcales cyanobacterium C]|uniref:Probable septum site-determining protein MinC n=1 Tax=Petrachloros mirabilis ULC683 TaxID=2781853 RepID=A0A8K1ZZ66_9CYAN|nr:septum site-determining protein MinC [Petrachloros mirabilis]NCJ06778.1 septum site-determining protein MinC [Petrachloros mirabilis ULC683]
MNLDISTPNTEATLPPLGETLTSPPVEPQLQFLEAAQMLQVQIPTPQETALDWQEIWQHLCQRLDASRRMWPDNLNVEVKVGERLLDQRQLQMLETALSGANLHLKRVCTSRRQTAMAAITAGYSVEQQTPQLTLAQKPLSRIQSPSPDLTTGGVAAPLYLQATLRSGREVSHPGSVILLGDLNPGSAIIAEGDILVWGRLRGIAHAGAQGNDQRLILALQMEPTQLRIADQVARAPETPPDQYHPEVAYVAEDGIRIARASHFSVDMISSSADR